MESEAVVLVVEDDALVGEFLSRALLRAGLTAVVARTGAAALQELAGRDFAAVIVDGLLPDIHGIDLVRRLLDGAAPATPICVISGALNEDIAPRAGIVALAKPVGPAKLNSTMEALICRRAASTGEGLAERRAALDRLAGLFTVKPS